MQYVPFASDVETPFYASLASQKINHDKLDDSARKVLGVYEIRPTDAKEHSCRMQIHGDALTNDQVSSTGAYRAEGMIKNVNTIEEYRNLDKMAMLQQAGKTIWDAINDGSIYSCPSLLSSFLAISFADLKKYRFSYWFAFPALVMEPAWVSATVPGAQQDALPYKVLTKDESEALVDAVQTWRQSVDSRQHGFFLVKKNRRARQQREASFDDLDDPHNPAPPPPSAIRNPDLNFGWNIGPLAAYDNGFFEGEYSDDCYIAFADPSNYTPESGTVAPGWMLRNLLALARQKWQRDRVQIMCYRETQTRRDAARSIILDLEVSKQPRKRTTSTTSGGTVGDESAESGKNPAALPKIVGWERDAKGRLAGRFADLTAYMDPTKLADQSVDLNLKLMKWRISPNLDLDKIKETKCLLLGAGTLGSYVSRNLMGWGVKKITFVDNGGVSYSNPVRQPLFNFKDCLDGGARKALRAAEALKEIYPGIDATGHVMSVPMAGHPVTDVEGTRGDFEKLQTLIKEHDAIFLLMDSRESRWLPTVIGKAEGKIVMNAALGFDTYVVMRHGVKLPNQDSSAVNLELGCYFCNDVVAPGDSMKDLTLDQQCTVTRPGIAAIASAMLVEILVSVLQHPLGGAAPAPTSPNQDRGDHPLGLVPHQIRGFLANFSHLNIVGKSYDCCSACSPKIVDTYKAGDWTFVEKALNEKDYVEELSGLKEVHRKAEEAAAALDLDDDEGADFDDDGEGELI